MKHLAETELKALQDLLIGRVGTRATFHPSVWPWRALFTRGLITDNGAVTDAGLLLIDATESKSIMRGVRITRTRDAQIGLRIEETGESVSDVLNAGLDELFKKAE